MTAGDCRSLWVRPMLEDFRNVVQIISGIGIFLVALQIWLSYRAAVGKNTMDLINFLQSENVRKARTYVIKELKENRSFPFGDQQAEEHASSVVSSYDVAAILIRERYVSKRVFVDDYGPSILLCASRLGEFISKRQKDAGQRYWNDFGELVDACKKVHNQEGINSANWTGLN